MGEMRWQLSLSAPTTKRLCPPALPQLLPPLKEPRAAQGLAAPKPRAAQGHKPTSGSGCRWGLLAVQSASPGSCEQRFVLRLPKEQSRPAEEHQTSLAGRLLSELVPPHDARLHYAAP